LTLRDTQSALELSERLKGARRIAIVGNGGIALELVHEIRTCEIIWAVRDSHIGNSFFDNDAAEFLAPSLSSRLVVGGEKGPGRTLLSHEWDGRGAAAGRSKLVGHAAVMGSALGPEWLTGAMNSDEPKNAGGEGSRVAGFLGKGGDRGEGQVKILLETNCEVTWMPFLNAAAPPAPFLNTECPLLRRNVHSPLNLNVTNLPVGVENRRECRRRGMAHPHPLDQWTELWLRLCGSSDWRRPQQPTCAHVPSDQGPCRRRRGAS